MGPCIQGRDDHIALIVDLFGHQVASNAARSNQVLAHKCQAFARRVVGIERDHRDTRIQGLVDHRGECVG